MKRDVEFERATQLTWKRGINRGEILFLEKLVFASLRKCKRILNKPGPWRFVDLWISFFSITFCSFFIWRRLLKGIRRIWRNKKFSKERKRGYFSWEFLKNSILSKMRFARNDFDSKKVNFLKQWKIPQKDKEIFEYFLYIFLENFKSILFEKIITEFSLSTSLFHFSNEEKRRRRIIIYLDRFFENICES